jgi:hypothetical protein
MNTSSSSQSTQFTAILSYLTPDRLIVGLLFAELLLWLSERFQWPAWHKGYAVLAGVAVLAATLVVTLAWYVIAVLAGMRFQFNLRSLLVLAVAVAAPFGWLEVEMNGAREQREAAAAIDELDGDVEYDFSPSSPCGNDLSATPTFPVASWLVRLLGEDFFSDATGALVHGPRPKDADLTHLKHLTKLRILSLDGDQFTDAGMEHLEGLVSLQCLYLESAQITDAGIKHLTGLNQLQELRLTRTGVTDAGLRELRKSLSNCEIER